MRQKRAKAYRKQMLVYNHTFKFREPYQCLVDDQIVINTNKASFELDKGLARTIQAQVKPMITQCCMQALYLTKNQYAIEQAKDYERRRCNHNPKEPLSPLDCIMSVVSIDGKNKHRYCVASQDEELRKKLRQVPGVPLIYMNRSVMVMEPLSAASKKMSEEYEQGKLTKGLNDAKIDVAEVQGKKRKVAQPNPLSVKKKKVEKVEEKKEEVEKKTRKRRHKKASATESVQEMAEGGENAVENVDSE